MLHDLGPDSSTRARLGLAYRWPLTPLGSALAGVALAVGLFASAAAIAWLLAP